MSPLWIAVEGGKLETFADPAASPPLSYSLSAVLLPIKRITQEIPQERDREGGRVLLPARKSPNELTEWAWSEEDAGLPNVYYVLSCLNKGKKENNLGFSAKIFSFLLGRADKDALDFFFPVSSY